MKFAVGVLGATGYIGVPYRSEMRESPDDARIVALCARRRDVLQAAAQEDGCAFFTDDWRQVVAQPQVNLVVVATPDALHYEQVMACAEHGKHVFCEKPVALNSRQVHEMYAACRSAQLGHYVPYWTRYVPMFRRARDIVATGTLGQIKAIVYRWHNPRPAAMPFTWRDDAELSTAGSVADVGSHAYDVVRWILGDEAQRVVAHADVITPPKPDLGAPNLEEALKWGQSHAVSDAASLRKGTAFDYGTVAVEFQCGAVGVFIVSHATFLRKGLAPELELHGTDASLAVDRISGRVIKALPDGHVETLETVPDPGFGNRFAKHVFPAIRQRAAGEPCKHPGLDDGYRVQLFVDAAALSARRGTWVELGELEA
jgi:predicted dehydrogenase